MLDINTFKIILEHAPLVSIDLCIVHDDCILLGKRSNRPLKDRWFTPGGRIFKNERWQDAISRIALDELGIQNNPEFQFKIMGLWDHIYSDSIFGSAFSTHYVNIPHYVFLDRKPKIFLGDQHSEFNWFKLSEVNSENSFHSYVVDYAVFLMGLTFERRLGSYVS